MMEQHQGVKERAELPCGWPAGTDRRVEIYRLRAHFGLPVFNSSDSCDVSVLPGFGEANRPTYVKSVISTPHNLPVDSPVPVH